MKVEDFLEIYKHPLAKLVFKKVKLLKSDVNGIEREYYHFIGKFEFIPPDSILSMDNPNDGKDEVVNQLKSVTDDWSVVYRKKFTRKINYKKDKNVKWKFEYVFDFKPFNIVDYYVDKKSGRMELQVVGYGIF